MACTRGSATSDAGERQSKVVGLLATDRCNRGAIEGAVENIVWSDMVIRPTHPRWMLGVAKRPGSLLRGTLQTVLRGRLARRDLRDVRLGRRRRRIPMACVSMAGIRSW